MSTLNALISNPISVIMFAVVACTVVPSVLVYWHKVKIAGIDADLKMKMLQMGMSADEIERVLKAQSKDDTELG